jgi:hypothetical protein
VRTNSTPPPQADGRANRRNTEGPTVRPDVPTAGHWRRASSLVPEIPGTAAARRPISVSIESLTILGTALEAGGEPVAWQLAREQGWTAQDIASTVALGSLLTGSLHCLVTAPGHRGPRPGSRSGGLVRHRRGMGRPPSSSAN